MHPQSTLLTSPRVCAFDGCGRSHESRGYCAGHAAQLRAGRQLAPILSRSECGRRNLRAAQEAWRARRVEMACEACAGSFVRHLSETKRRFCSRSCAYAFMRGPNGAGALANLKQPRIPWNKGQGDQAQRRPAYYDRGSEGPIERWRRAVYHRDAFTCQRCGDDSGGNLEAHHIIAWADEPALRFEVFNGVTLCEACHKRMHAGRATCSICGRASIGRQLCGKHYLRWRAYGDPLLTKRRAAGAWVLGRVES